MPEPHSAPIPGGDENTPASGGTPNAPGNDAPPKSENPMPSIDEIRHQGFTAGYGKGADKGRKEGAAVALQSLGLPDSLEEARAYLSRFGEASESSTPTQDIKVTETEEYRSLATEHTKAAAELEQLREQLEGLQVRADEARVEKFRSAARSKGVGEAQLPALVSLFGHKVRLNDDGDLEVLSKMPDGNLAAAGVTVDSYLESITKDNPWLLAPQQASGAGSTLGPTSAPRKQDREAAPFVDRRSLRERLTGK